MRPRALGHRSREATSRAAPRAAPRAARRAGSRIGARRSRPSRALDHDREDEEAGCGLERGGEEEDPGDLLALLKPGEDVEAPPGVVGGLGQLGDDALAGIVRRRPEKVGAAAV